MYVSQTFQIWILISMGVCWALIGMKCIVCIIRVHLFVLGIIDPSDTKDDAKPFSVPDFKKIPSRLVCGYHSMCL